MDEQIARNRRRSYLLVGLAFVLLFLVAEAFGLLIGGGWFGLLLAVGIALAGTWGSYYWSDRLALTITGAREAPPGEFPELVNVVEELAIASGLPRPRVFVVDDPAPNAFATGRDPEHAVVAATTGLLKVMDREQLQGVMAHELSHVQNRDTLVATLVVTVCGAIVLLCDLAWRISFFGGSSRRDNDRDGNGLALLMLALGVIALIVAPLGAALIQSAVSRRREQLADFSAVEMSRNPAGLRRALETLMADRTVVQHTSRATAHLWIESPLDRKAEHGGWLNRLYDTHPPLEQRIAALRVLEAGS